MRTRTTVAVSLCLAAFAASFLLSGEPMLFVNFTALLVVISGTLGATLLSGGAARLIRAVRAARAAYAPDAAPESSAIVGAYLRLGLAVRREGYLRAADADLPDYAPLREAVELLEDNYAGEEIVQMAASEAQLDQASRADSERLLRAMATYAPSFGVAGSVIGLIGLLMGLGDTSLILANIPVALVSTLYGVVLATLVCTPAAEQVREAGLRELSRRRLVAEGAALLAEQPNLRRLHRRLNALVPEAERLDERAAFAALRRSLKTPDAEPDPETTRRFMAQAVHDAG